MKNVGNLLAVLGVLIIIYAIVGRFVGDQTIGLGIVRVQALSGLTLANSLILIALVIKSGGK